MSTKKILNLVIFINLICIGISVFLFLTIQSKNRSIGVMQSSIESILGANDQSVVLKNVLDETKKDRQKIQEFFVDKDSIADFLEYIESLGKSAGVKASVSVLSEEDHFSVSGMKAPVLKLVIGATGSWQGIYRYLNLLENLPYREEISAVSLRSQVGTSFVADGKNVQSKKAEEWSGTFELNILKNN